MPTPPPPYPDELPQAATRAAALSADYWTPGPGRIRPGDRVAATATLAWQMAYPIAYAHGYNTLVHRAAAAIQELHDSRATAEPPHSIDTQAVRHLAELTQTLAPEPDQVLPMPKVVIRDAVKAALNNHTVGVSSAQAITMDVHTRAAWTAGVSGALTAARDIQTIWHHLAGTEQHTTDQISERLATLNRDFITDWMSRDHRPAAPATIARSSFPGRAVVASPANRTSTEDTRIRRFIFRGWRRR